MTIVTRLAGPALTLALVAGCVSGVPMVPLEEDGRMTTEPGPRGGRVLTTLRLEGTYQGDEQLAERAAYCATTTVTKDPALLRDARHSWVSPWTGTYYNWGVDQVADGDGKTVKIVDADAGRAVFVGREFFAYGLQKSFVDFVGAVETVPGGYTLTFSRLSHTMTSTGIAANDGAMPVGMWRGAAGGSVVGALERVAARFDACMAG